MALISFLIQALDFLQQNSRNLQFIRTKPLPVSGAFHTELMESAAEPLRDVLRQVEVSLTQSILNSFMIFFEFLLLTHCGSYFLM